MLEMVVGMPNVLTSYRSHRVDQGRSHRMIPVRWADVNNGACCGVSMAEKDWKQGKGQEGRKTYIEWAGTEKGGISALPCPPLPGRLPKKSQSHASFPHSSSSAYPSAACRAHSMTAHTPISPPESPVAGRRTLTPGCPYPTPHATV